MAFFTRNDSQLSKENWLRYRDNNKNTQADCYICTPPRPRNVGHRIEMLAVQSLPDVTEKIRYAAPVRNNGVGEVWGRGMMECRWQVRISLLECVFYTFPQLSPFTL